MLILKVSLLISLLLLLSSSWSLLGLVTETVGTPSFWSPESIQCIDGTSKSINNDLGLDFDDDDDGNNDKNDNGNQFSAYCLDYWAIGITGYCFLTGTLPFYSSDDNITDLLHQILYKNINIEYNNTMNNNIVNIVKGLLQRDPSERWDIYQVYDCIK